MTEYEILDLQSSWHQTVVAVSMAFLAICSGFAITVHFIGTRLSRAQLAVFVFVYSVYLYLPIRGVYWAANKLAYLQVELQRLGGSAVPDPSPVYYQAAAFVLIWLLTLYYCWYVRKDG